jgi:hypothetical protein
VFSPKVVVVLTKTKLLIFSFLGSDQQEAALAGRCLSAFSMLSGLSGLLEVMQEWRRGASRLHSHAERRNEVQTRSCSRGLDRGGGGVNVSLESVKKMGANLIVERYTVSGYRENLRD